MKYLNKSFLAAILMVMVAVGCSSEKKEAQEETAPQKAETSVTDTLTSEEHAQYMAKSKELVDLTMKTLGGNLMKALKEEGIAHAAEFCKLQADPLVDSLETANSVVIRRATLKPRNQENMADSLEESVIMGYMEQIKSGQAELKPELVKTSTGDVHFFAPIKIPAPMCLKCHGKLGETLSEEDYKNIKELYPDDKAIGYEKGDLRGIWNIKFPANANL